MTSVNTALGCLLARPFPWIPWRHLRSQINAYYIKNRLSWCDWPDCGLNNEVGYTNWRSHYRWQFFRIWNIIRGDDGYFEHSRIYFTLHGPEECKSKLSTSQKGLTVLCQCAWGNDVYFDSRKFNTHVRCKTQTIEHNICVTSLYEWCRRLMALPS